MPESTSRIRYPIETMLVGAAAVIMAGYMATLSPTIAGGDSGEIVAEGCELGIAHPPGYPILTMMIHLLSRFDIEGVSIAMSVNFCSAMFTSAAALLMGFVICRLSPSKSNFFGAIAGMSLFAFSPLIWQYAVTAEVFPMNTMFAAWLIYLVVCFSQEQRFSTLLIGAFSCGLAICNQHTIILYEVPLILWMLALIRPTITKSPRILFLLGCAFLFGLIPYIYLPISQHYHHHRGSWGYVKSVYGFIHHFLRKDYGTFTLFSGAAGRNAEGLWVRNMAYLKDAMNVQSGQYGAVLAVFGVIASILSPFGVLDPVYWQRRAAAAAASRRRIPPPTAASGKKNKRNKQHQPVAEPVSEPVASAVTATAADDEEDKSSSDLLIDERLTAYTPLILLFTQLFYFFIFHSLANLPLGDKLLYGVHQRFWMQPNVLLFIWIGIGFNFVSSLVLHVSDYLAPSLVVRNFGVLSLSVLLLITSFGLGYMQFKQWYTISDQSKQMFFLRYAQAVLAPVPQKSILLINYDQQWTSVRYAQLCEGFQAPVTTMHLSLMTYPWFATQRHAYAKGENISFPGTFVAHPQSRALKEDNAFTLKQFLDINIKNNFRIYLGGKLNYQDAELNKEYDFMPVGLVSMILPHSKVPAAPEYMQLAIASWSRVIDFLPQLPNVAKYPEETWEWTIGRDFKDRLADTAAYMLFTAMKVEDADYKPLIEATYWLETSILFEGKTASASLLKNTGLAHVHLLQNKMLKDRKNLGKPSKDLFNSTVVMDWPKKQWRDWSASRFMTYWNAFLEKPESKQDPQYELIKNMVKQVSSVAANKTTPKQQAAEKQQQQQQVMQEEHEDKEEEIIAL